RSVIYDLDYRLTAITSGEVQKLSYTYDVNNNITRCTYGSHFLDNFSYQYDELSRLKGVYGYQVNDIYTYDRNNNRLTESTAFGTTNYVTSPGSDRLISINGAHSKSFTHDALGNTISSGSNTSYTYDQFNRKRTVARGGLPTTYLYNALNQRVRKTAPVNVNYAYTPNGWLLGETSIHSSAFNKEYIWLEGQLIGLIYNGALYYV